MRWFCLRRRGAVLTVVGALALAVALPLRGEADTSAKAHPAPARPRSPGSAGDTDTDTSKVSQCGVDANGRSLSLLKLVGRDGLQFKCGSSETLGPPAAGTPKGLINVFEYDEQGACNSQKAVSLDSLIRGATLTESTEENKTKKAAEPVYTLNYKSGPEKEQSLCYTCNTSSNPRSVFSTGQPVVSCTVQITVPARTPPPANPSEPPPTSGAGATAAGVAAVAGGFLLVVLLF